MEKVQANYSIDSGLKETFDKYCDENDYNKSGVVNTLINGWLVPKLNKKFKAKLKKKS